MAYQLSDICELIKRHVAAEITTQGGGAPLLFEPYIIHSYTCKGGESLVEGYEVSDQGEAGEQRDWRELHQLEIFSVSPTDRAFEPDEAFSSRIDRYGMVYCAIDRPR